MDHNSDYEINDRYESEDKKDKNAPMTLGQWIVTSILLAIPFANVIFYLMWLFGVGNLNRVRYIRANFIVGLVCFIIIALFIIILMVVFKDQINQLIAQLQNAAQ